MTTENPLSDADTALTEALGMVDGLSSLAAQISEEHCWMTGWELMTLLMPVQERMKKAMDLIESYRPKKT